ncbi:MAG: hypothetical protein WCG01_04560 [bacterium]
MSNYSPDPKYLPVAKKKIKVKKKIISTSKVDFPVPSRKKEQSRPEPKAPFGKNHVWAN